MHVTALPYYYYYDYACHKQINFPLILIRMVNDKNAPLVKCGLGKQGARFAILISFRLASKNAPEKIPKSFSI